MERILECCCGVDVHKDMIEACIIKGLENPQFIRMQFSTFPSSLKDFVEWVYENDCYHIAMESTGVYWRPVYESIEANSPYYENIVVAKNCTCCDEIFGSNRRETILSNNFTVQAAFVGYM